MARTSKDPQLKKTHRLNLRLTDIEYERCMNNAKAANITLSEYIRHVLRHEPVTIRHTVQAEVLEISKMYAALYATANNLNQLTRYFHMGGSRSVMMQNEIIEGIHAIFEMRDTLVNIEEELHGSLKTHRDQKQ